MKLLPMTKNVVLSPADYVRDIRHYEIDLSSSGFTYSVGDCLGVMPKNDPEQVLEFLNEFGLDPNTSLTLKDTQVWQITAKT